MGYKHDLAYRFVRNCKDPCPLAVGGGHTKHPYNHQKKAAWCNQSSLRILKLLLVFYFLSTDLNAFDFRSVRPAGVQTIYFSLPSPHIPIAALAANRVIIIVINITFYLKTIILTKF